MKNNLKSLSSKNKLQMVLVTNDIKSYKSRNPINIGVTVIKQK